MIKFKRPVLLIRRPFRSENGIYSPVKHYRHTHGTDALLDRSVPSSG